MNFLGHAAIARWSSRAPRVLFGAMLPDFVGMAGVALPEVHCPEITRGIALHHATDDVFHRAPTFRELAGTAARDLQARGVPRGPALAVGHVGIELLLDCSLARDTELASDYLAAVAAFEALASELGWHAPEPRERFARLGSVLMRRGLAVGDPEPTHLTTRLYTVLAHRPRLALAESSRPTITEWARTTFPTVIQAEPRLLDELRAGLGSGDSTGRPC